LNVGWNAIRLDNADENDHALHTLLPSFVRIRWKLELGDLRFVRTRPWTLSKVGNSLKALLRFELFDGSRAVRALLGSNASPGREAAHGDESECR
jgi:hypothetical protein